MAKFNITAVRPMEVKTAQPSRSLERKMQGFLSAMIEGMAKTFENNTFKKLNKGTVEKFEDNAKGVPVVVDGVEFKDAQVGNYAKVFLSLSRKSRRMMLKRFSDKRIHKIVTDILLKVKKQNAEHFYSKVENITGISQSRLSAAEALKPQTNALILETAEWATKLRDDALNQFTADTLRGMAQGKGIDEIIEEFGVLTNKRVTRAKMVARTQVSTFNSLLSKTRAQNLGIKKAIWVTSKDERVRVSHAKRDGMEFDLSKGLPISSDDRPLLPGVDYNCRCDYKMIIPEE